MKTNQEIRYLFDSGTCQFYDSQKQTWVPIETPLWHELMKEFMQQSQGMEATTTATCEENK